MASRLAVVSYALVLLAALCGVVGMALVYTGASERKTGDLLAGLPLLFIGLWWCGIQLGRGQAAGRARRAARRRARSADRLGR